jgi:hypothetical protein
MNMTKSNFKNKVKDWFIIQRIRLTNFAKEHKYISAFIGIFLMSSIVALIVFATDGDPYEHVSVSEGTATPTSISGSDKIDTTKTFSTIVYNIRYKLSPDETGDAPVAMDEVVIKAKLPKDLDVDWITQDIEATYEMSETDTEKILTMTMYQVTVGEVINKQLYLKVNNVREGIKISPDISIMNGDSEVKKLTDENITVTVAVDKVVPLTAKLVSGVASSSNDAEGFTGRYVPFGILVGIDKKYLKDKFGITVDSLEGLYFNSDIELILEATQEVKGVTSQIELEENKNYFGLYDKRSNLLPSMPHYIQDYSQDSVYNSGTVNSFKKSNEGVSGSSQEPSSNPKLWLIGKSEINLKIGEEYIEYGVSTRENGEDICTSNSNCTIAITNSYNETVGEINTSKKGNYTITYTYKDGKYNVTTLTRKVSVSGNKTSQTLDGVEYYLAGNENIVLLTGNNYSAGLLTKSDTGEYENYTGDYGFRITDKDGVEITNESGEPISVSELAPGEYKFEYTIEVQSSEEPSIDEENPGTEEENSNIEEDQVTTTEPATQSITLTRTVTVADNYTYTKAGTIKANTIYAASDGEFEGPQIYFNGATTPDYCNSGNHCEVTYYDSLGVTDVGEPNSSRAGTYLAVYTVTVNPDENNPVGYVIQTSNYVNFQTKYSFKITGIKSDGTITLYGEDFIALGSYFVTAKSERPTDVEDDITVNLKASIKKGEGLENIEETASVNNPNYSAGTKTNILTFNTIDSLGALTPLSGTDTLAYGEEVILRSVFYYSNDGDDNIGTLTTTIPVGLGTSTNNSASPFTMTEYSSSLEDTEPYYINDSLKDKISVTYYACKINSAGSGCEGETTPYTSFNELNDDLATNTDLKLAYVTYTIQDVEPGTEVDFRLRLVTNIGNHAGTVTMTPTSLCDDVPVENINNASIGITAFKARTNVFVDGSEQDIIINGANTSNSTWSIYPTVTLPAETVNTNAAGINELDSVTVVVTLPEGLNYVYNENYDIPAVSDGGRTLTYELRGKHVNEWIDPIYFDVSYDINIPSGEQKPVSVLIQAKSTTGVEDASSDKLRTATRTITYQNNEIVAHALYTSNTAIAKETSFDVNTALYNNSNIARSNLDIVTLLPYNDVSNEDSYTGTYTISNLPEGALCSTSLPTLIADNDRLVSGQEITWEDCSNYADNNYLGVTAIRVNGINLEKAEVYNQTMTITPTANKTGDVYNINSYLIMDRTPTEENQSTRRVANSKSLKVEVISKQITGTVWEDFDANGIMDSTEKKVSGVTLKLYNSENDELIKTTTSDEKGEYRLTDLEPGTYYVVAEYNTAKYGVTAPQVTLDKSITSSFRSTGDEVVGDDNPSDEDEDSTQGSDSNQNEENDAENDNEDDTTSGDEQEPCEGEDCDATGEEEEEPSTPNSVVRTDDIVISENTKAIRDINLGLALRKEYSVKVRKYVTRAITTNNLGVSTIKEYGNATLAKLDVKDISNLSIKVVYTIELENTGYYPGYIYAVKDYVPDGMQFNPDYEENAGWVMTDYGYLENDTLFDELVQAGEKKYLTIAFDIVRKEAGSFVNYAEVEDEDLQILIVGGSRLEEGDGNE